MCGCKKAYLTEVQSRRRDGKDLLFTELPTKKIGHPLMLGEAMDKELQRYLLDLGKVGGVVNAEIAIVSGKGLVRRKDSRLLAENGGYMVFTKDWAHYLLAQIGFVKRKANSKVKISVNDFDELKEQFLCSISAIVENTDALILNWDHTALKYVLVSSWTMAEQGAKKSPWQALMTSAKLQVFLQSHLMANSFHHSLFTRGLQRHVCLM